MVIYPENVFFNVEQTFSSNGDELDSFAGDKVQGFVDVSDFVKSHLAAVRLGQGLAGNDLEQEHELESIPEILLDVLDLCSSLAQVGVDPCGESLENNNKYDLVNT